MKKVLIPIEPGRCFDKPSGKKKYFVAVAPVFQLPYDQFPLDANLRRPKSKAGLVKSMIRTLQTSPDEFFESSMGIVIVAKNARYEYTSGIETGIWVEMLTPLHGVANGGHTLSAIKQASELDVDLTEAFVSIRVNVGIPDSVLKNMVVRLNTSTKVTKPSILYKNGKFDAIEASLQVLGYNDVVNYYQNQAEDTGRREDGRQNIVHVIQLVTVLDKKRCNPDAMSHPTFAVRGGSNLMQDKSLARVEDLILDFLPYAVKIEKQMYKCLVSDMNSTKAEKRHLPGVKPADSFLRHSLLLDKSSFEYNVPSVYSLPLISAFRAFIEDDKWLIPMNDSVLEDFTKKLWAKYSEFLRDQWKRGNKAINGIVQGDEVWMQLFTSANKLYIQYLQDKAKKNDNTAPQNGKVTSTGKNIVAIKSR